MAPAGGGRLVRLANLWRLPFQHLHAELEVPHLIRYPFRRAAADDDRFRVVREAHHDQRVPGAQRRARARVLDLRSGGQWVSRYHLQLAAGERVGSAERYLLPSERFWGALLEAETNSSLRQRRGGERAVGGGGGRRVAVGRAAAAIVRATRHSHPSSAIRGSPPPRAWPARPFLFLTSSAAPPPVRVGATPPWEHAGRATPRPGPRTPSGRAAQRSNRSWVQQFRFW